MPRREYVNPPIHEVAIELKFTGVIAEQVLRGLQAPLAQHFGEAVPLQENSFQVAVAPSGEQAISAISGRFTGWQFKRENEGSYWLVVVGADRIATHCVRSLPWPSGPYAGWPRVREAFSQALAATRDEFAGVTLKRVGVRYVNRVAIPPEEPLSTWFTVGIQAPPQLVDPFAFDLQQTWAMVRDNPDVGATMRFARIAVQDPGLTDRIGIMLDVDVFNFRIDAAPPRDGVLAWIDRAHEIENAIFESSITDALRARLNEPVR